MLLQDVLKDLTCSGEIPEDMDIIDLAYDSREAGAGIAFVCLKGAKADGHNFAKDAYGRGSRVFASEKPLDLPEDALVIIFDDTRAALAAMSDNFFRHPSKELAVIGVTGTKGKTTVTHMIKAALDNCGYEAGLIGTVGAVFGDKKYPTVNTTPESYALQKLLRMMADDGCKAACIEVSSLGLKSHRVDKIDFTAGVFTNLSSDHVGGGEHESFEEYAFWKEQLFKHCALSIVNSDDEFSGRIIDASPCTAVTFGIENEADYTARNIEFVRTPGFLGVKFDYIHQVKSMSVKVSMPGLFTVYNTLAAIAVLESLKLPEKDIRHAFENIAVNGRSEIIRVSSSYDVIIDYAHNGISFKNILETLKMYHPKRLICLYGCVGERAQVRRKEMGRISGAMADMSIITSDDPGFEDPAGICDEVAGYVEEAGGKAVKIPDRGEAIRYALSLIEAGDILVLLGKGHELYQKIKGEKVYFSERECIEEYFNEQR